MLDSALETKTTESLNRWIDEQIEADRASVKWLEDFNQRPQR